MKSKLKLEFGGAVFDLTPWMGSTVLGMFITSLACRKITKIHHGKDDTEITLKGGKSAPVKYVFMKDGGMMIQPGE